MSFATISFGVSTLLAIAFFVVVVPSSAIAQASNCGTCPSGTTCEPVATSAAGAGEAWACQTPIQTSGGSNGAAPVAGGSSAGQSSGNTTLKNPLGTGATLNTLLADILQFVVRIGSIIVILMLVYVGFMFVVARGNPAEISKARQALMWTVIGALVLLGAEAIAQGIQATVQALSVGS